MRQVNPNLAKVAALIGDPVRAGILFALLDAPEFPASELAFRSNASAQAASAHLSKLVEGGLLQVRSEGRQRLFRLASPDVARAIETLASIAPAQPVVSLTQHTTMQRLRAARSCYDHLAGRLGVALTQALVHQGTLCERSDDFDLTHAGEAFFSELGLDVHALREKQRSFARSCLDWTERRPHLAGSLGAAILDHAITTGWLTRARGNRYLNVTPLGQREFSRIFGLTVDPCG